MGQTEKKESSNKTPQRTRISDIRRKELVTAALRCISVKGYDRVTLDDVAKEAGFSQGIALYYFKNRETLLTSAIESIWDDLKALTRSIWNISDNVKDDNKIFEYARKFYSDPDIDLITVIESGIKILINWFIENPHIIVVAMEFWSQVPRNSMMNEVKDSMQPYVRNTTAIVIEEGIKRGLFKKRDPQIASHVLLSVITGFAFSHVITPKDVFSIQELEKEFSDLVFDYLRT